MSKFEVKTGTMAVEVLGITNYNELQKILGEKTAQEVVCKNSTDKKEILENVKHYKAIRTPLKKTRAEANKMLKAKSKEILDEFDTAIKLVSDYIEPYEEAVIRYDEEVKARKLERLKTKFIPEIENLNKQIRGINDGLGKELIEFIEFNETWVSKSEKAIFALLNDFVDTAEKQKAQIENNILAVATKAESLKIQYDLQSELNYQLILGDRIYTDGLADLQDRLEEFAFDQQRSEAEAAERAEAEAKRQADKERIEAELQKQRDIEAAQEKARAEERAKIKKERQEEEARKKQIEENDRKFRQQEEIKRMEVAKVKVEAEPSTSSMGLRLKDYTINFPQLSKDKAEKMLEFFNENKIKFEVI